MNPYHNTYIAHLRRKKSKLETKLKNMSPDARCRNCLEKELKFLSGEIARIS